jgi:DNA-binding NarL/FixJ family response regulator
VEVESSQATVGREAELAQLNAALDALDAARATCLAVAGEPGIGKTHLMAELRRRSEDRRHIVVAGSATEFERDLPFSAWASALDAYVASQELDLDDDWDEGLVGELGEVLPSLRSPGGHSLGSVPDERYRVHRAVRRLLDRLSRVQPLVVVLDDLHWSDAASVELLAALLRRPPEAAILIALAFRPAQAPPRLEACLAAPMVQMIALQPLSQADSAALLRGLDPDAAADIYRHGGGNPFYLEQLARMIHGRNSTAGPRDDPPIAASGVPGAVAASLAEEIASLPVQTRAMLQSAAVAGDPFEPELAADIAELPLPDALAELDALLAADLVRPTDTPRRFVFRHPLVRRWVYDATPGGWRIGAHARSAKALAVRGAAPAERAHHVEQSASMGDEDAIALLLDAGGAAALRAPAASARWFDATLRLLPDSDERQVDVRIALASALRSQGELERCRDTLVEAANRLPGTDVLRRAMLTAQCAAVEHWLGEHNQAHHRLVREWHDLPDRVTGVAAALQIEMAVDGLYELNFGRAVEMGRRAVATARAVDDRLLVAAAVSVLAFCETTAGNVTAAREYAKEAQSAIDILPDTELAPRLESLYYLAWAETYLERYPDALKHIDRGLAISRATGAGHLLVPLQLARNFPLEMQGRLPEAIEICETALEAAQVSASPHEVYRALFELGWTRYFAGDLDGAIAAYEECARIDPRPAGGTIPNAGGGPGWGLGVAWFESGQVERGRKVLVELGAEGVARTVPVERCFDWESLAMVELAAGNTAAAAGYASRAEEDSTRLGLMLPAALAGRARAAVLLASGEPLKAAETAAESAAAASAIAAQLQAAFSRGLQGRALAAAGRRREAIDVLRQAEQELDRCASVRVRDQIRRELRRLGARREPRGPASPDESGLGALTGRELEIANLVTQRRTNREIADALFLSEKTIESHMRSIFRKLGVSSRIDVARTIERERLDG